MNTEPERRVVSEVEEPLEDYDTLGDIRTKLDEWIAQNGEDAQVIWYSNHVEIRVTRLETDKERDARLEAFRKECAKYEIASAGWSRLTEDERRALGHYLAPRPPNGYEPPSAAPTLGTPGPGRIPPQQD